MNNKVKDNYQHIFERLINKEKVWLLQNTFQRHGVDGSVVKHDGQIEIENVLMFKRLS